MIDIKMDDKPNRTDAYQYSVNSWKHWAENNNAEVVVLNEPISDSTIRPNWYKYYVFDLLDNNKIEYDQILYVDSDTIVHPDCPNFFKLSERKFCGVHNTGSYDWLFRSLENYSKYLFNGYMFDFTKYFNSGFMIMNKEHKPLFEAIRQFYDEHKKTIDWVRTTYNCGIDQPIINFLVQLYNIELKILPYEYNMQDLVLHEGLTENLLFWKFGYVAHLNAIPNNVNSTISNQWMQYIFEKTWKN